MRRQIADRRGSGIKKEQGVYIKGCRVESGNNPVVSQCTNSRIWKTMEDDRASH